MFLLCLPWGYFMTSLAQVVGGAVEERVKVGEEAGFLTIRHTPYGLVWFMAYGLSPYGTVNHILPI